MARPKHWRWMIPGLSLIVVMTLWPTQVGVRAQSPTKTPIGEPPLVEGLPTKTPLPTEAAAPNSSSC